MKNYQKIPSFVTSLKYIHSDRNFNVSRTNFEVMEIMENYKSLIISHRYSSIYHPIRWLEIALTFLYRRLKISFSKSLPPRNNFLSFSLFSNPANKSASTSDTISRIPTVLLEALHLTSRRKENGTMVPGQGGGTLSGLISRWSMAAPFPRRLSTLPTQLFSPLHHSG